MTLVVDAAFHLHRDLGPGLLESVYEVVLNRRLEARGLFVQRQVPVSFDYDGMRFEDAFRADLIVERSVVVELKSVEQHTAVHLKQLLTYLRLLDIRLGLLINFGAPTFRKGIRRVVNDHGPLASSCLRVRPTVPADGHPLG